MAQSGDCRPKPPAPVRALRRLPGRRLPAALAALLLGAAPCAAAPKAPALKTYQTRYYVIHTDLDRDGAREAAIRMTAMAEEYHRRTRGFSGVIRSRLPFYLFRRAEDYYAAGGPRGSAGGFTGRALMAIAGDHPTDSTWQVVQHEGFHQFAHAVIRGDIPVWVNEGLAEYFGHAIFTGDDFVTGVVPPYRLQRLKKEIEAGKLMPFRRMMQLSYRQWSGELAIANYDQAWSMVHFLVHGEDGRYLKPMSGFMNDIGRSLRYENAWVKNFGRDIDGFEKRWREYWLAQPTNPTEDLYAKAAVATVTGFFARAYSQKQTFATAAEFFQAAEQGKLKAHNKDWLPPVLLEKNLAKAKSLGPWAIEKPQGLPPLLTCTAGEDRKFVGLFRVEAGRVEQVRVRLEGREQPDRLPEPATSPGEGARPAVPSAPQAP
ncbi:MAG: hypothetical protein AMJ81_05355 [Phycisphaerae bacterium SM23_33]|nr:MAG: hypothetical protein AMJ81_05355 [Phycisphaerae bacterium SM23_33]